MKALPKGWRTVPLSEVVDLASGQVDPREEPYSRMLHVGGDNIKTNTGTLFGMQTAGELGRISGKYLFDERDILYSKIRPYLNKVATPDFTGVCSADIYPLRPKNGVATREFIAKVLRTSDFLDFTETCSSRTSIPKINRDSLLRYQCSLPPLPEQKRIAAILDKADAIRRKRQEAIRLTEELLRSAFLEMFGDPVTNPKGWEVRTLGETIRETQYGTAEKANTQRIGLPVLRMNNITYGGAWDLSDVKWCEIPERDLAKYTTARGDLLFNRTNSPELVGKTAVWESDDVYAIAGYLIRVRFNELAEPRYVSGFLNSRVGKHLLFETAKPSNNMSNFSASELRRLALPLPPIELQKRFSKLAIATRGRIPKQEEAMASARDLFRSLAQRAFSGRL